MEMISIETDLTPEEITEFNNRCAEIGVCPAQKIGELIHGFILAEGVKHRIEQKVA